MTTDFAANHRVDQINKEVYFSLNVSAAIRGLAPYQRQFHETCSGNRLFSSISPAGPHCAAEKDTAGKLGAAGTLLATFLAEHQDPVSTDHAGNPLGFPAGHHLGPDLDLPALLPRDPIF